MPEDNDYLEKLPEDLEEIERDPIIKPLLDFREGTEFAKRSMEAESEALTKKKVVLQKLLDTGIFDESPIAKPYAEVLDTYERIFLILKQYAEKADKAIYRMKVTTGKYYIPKSTHQKIMYDRQTPEYLPPIRQVSKNPIKEMEEFDQIVQAEKQLIEEPKKKRTFNDPWHKHIAKTQAENPGLPLRKLLPIAKETYKK